MFIVEARGYEIDDMLQKKDKDSMVCIHNYQQWQWSNKVKIQYVWT